MTNLDEHSILSYSILKTIFDSFPNPTYIWQSVGNSIILVDSNKAANNDKLLNINHLVNETASDFFKKQPLILKKIKECMEKGWAEIEEIKIRSQSINKEVYLSLNFIFVPNDLVVLYINDITDRKLIEKDLENSKEKYKHLFEQAPFPIVIIDHHANIIDCNKATMKIFGYQWEDLIEKNYLELSVYPPEYIPILEERLEKSWKGIEVEPLHLKLNKKDGSIIWIVSILSRVNVKGVTLLQAILLDITEIKEANLLITHKFEIEKVISSISSRFIGNNDIDDAIDKSLIEMGNLISAKKAYLLLNNEDRTVEFYSQVYCTRTTSSNNNDVMNLFIDDFPYILKEYEKKGFVYIKNISELPEKESQTKTQLEKLNIESLLLFPIIIKEKLLGFIGFDNLEELTHWRADDLILLKTSSEIIGNALEKKWGEETLKNTNQLLTAILCSLTECIILIDKEFNIVWVNNETENLFNSQFTGKKCFEFLLNSKKPCKHCIARKTFSDGKIHENEYIFKDKGKSIIKCWCTTNVASKDKNNDIQLVIIIIRIINDLTHSKKD